MRHPNTMAAAIFAAIGGFAAYEARRFPATGAIEVGPRVFPVAAATLMIALSVTLAVLDLVGRERLVLPSLERRTVRDWGVVAVVTLAGLAAWRAWGYLAATFILVWAVVQLFERGLDRHGWWNPVLFSGAITAVFWLLFVVLLHVPLKVVG